jgi:hypothetical protein
MACKFPACYTVACPCKAMTCPMRGWCWAKTTLLPRPMLTMVSIVRHMALSVCVRIASSGRIQAVHKEY